LRRITVARPDKLTPLVLATNDLTTTATVIAQHYKDRWNIELFFKWMKQHLQIKRFFGCNENAVKTQVLCALIVYLLLSLYRKAHAKQPPHSGCSWPNYATRCSSAPPSSRALTDDARNSDLK
jgi:hypothetical protein